MYIDRFQPAPLPATPPSPRDLADFHLRWPEFRPFALDAMNGCGLCAEHAQTLAWLIVLADRVGTSEAPL